jgi:hypothetical protein
MYNWSKTHKIKMYPKNWRKKENKSSIGSDKKKKLKCEHL